MEKTFNKINKYFVALKLINFLVKEEDKYSSFFMYGGNINLLNNLNIESLKNNNLYSQLNLNNKYNDYKVLLVDSVNDDKIIFTETIIKNIKNNDIIIFINGNKRSYFVDNNYNNFKFLIPIKIEYSDKTFEFIYLYCKNNKILENGLSFIMTKKLKYSNIVIDVDMTNSTELKVLEGINKSLEERLTEITNYNKSLRRENTDLKTHIFKLESKINEISNKENIFQYLKNKFIRIFEKFFKAILKHIDIKKYKKYNKDRVKFFKDSNKKIIKFCGRIINK